MNDDFFKKNVLENQEMILELLTSPDINSEFKKIILNQKKIITELELRVRQLDEDFSDLKDEYNDISRELDSVKKENFVLIKKSSIKKVTYPLRSVGKNILNENLNIDGLIENKEFSLKLLQKEKLKKFKIVKKFKIFIYILAYERHEDNLESFLSFLDVKDEERDKSIEELAHREWISGMGFSSSLSDLVEIIENIPQKDRLNNVIAKFENLIS